MADEVTAIERCTYCRAYVPVTHVTIPPNPTDEPMQARVAVCERCFGDGR
ncbi:MULTISPECIES: hypothetical protein [Halorussus]|nr:hypothetical protein [Halorussus vallis]USZ76801.1 hypothetical protein NGM07_05605 [Halorussus vallis]